jgi:hypothetical protein
VLAKQTGQLHGTGRAAGLCIEPGRGTGRDRELSGELLLSCSKELVLLDVPTRARFSRTDTRIVKMIGPYCRHGFTPWSWLSP